MTVTLTLWMFPAIITVIALGLALFLPVQGPSNAYDFGGAFDFFLRLVAALFVSLISWLIYAIIV